MVDTQSLIVYIYDLAYKYTVKHSKNSSHIWLLWLLSLLLKSTSAEPLAKIASGKAQSATKKKKKKKKNNNSKIFWHLLLTRTQCTFWQLNIKICFLKLIWKTQTWQRQKKTVSLFSVFKWQIVIQIAHKNTFLKVWTSKISLATKKI